MPALRFFAVLALLCQAATAAPRGAPGALAGLRHVRRIIIRVVPGPGRGNTAAAVIAAEEIRRAGFTGELIMAVPRPAFGWLSADAIDQRETLLELLPDYVPLPEESQIVRVGGGVMTVADLPLGKSIFEQITTSYPPWIGAAADLELRFGSRFEQVAAGRNSRLLIATDLVSVTDPRTVISLRGRGGDAENFEMANLSGLGGLGLFGDPVAQEVGLRARRSVAARQQLILVAGRILRQEALRLGRPVLSALVPWMEEAVDSPTRSFAVAYGLGFNDAGEAYSALPNGMEHFFHYLNALGALPQGPGRTILLAQVPGPEQIAALRSRGHAVVNLASGEALGDEPLPGQIKIIVCGGLPRAAYLRLVAASDLPPIIEGNASASALMKMGRTFLMASSRHNGAMRHQIADLISETDPEAAEQFARFGAVQPFDMAPLLGGRAEWAFEAMGSRFERPLAVTFVQLADRLLANPAQGAGELAQWQAKAEEPGSAPRLCRDYLDSVPAPAGFMGWFRRLLRL